MILTESEIKEYIEKPRAQEFLLSAGESQKQHQLHVLGKGFHEWLEEQAAGIESAKTLERKKRFCTPKTVSITAQIMKQFMKAFRAKGNVFQYNFSGDNTQKSVDFSLYLKDFSKGFSMDEVMQNKWFEAMFTDFRGFMAVELTPYDKLIDPNIEQPYITLYPTHCVHDVWVEGNRVEYVILKWVITIGNEEREAFRVIDDEKDTIYYREGDSIVQAMRTDAEGNTVPDSFKQKFKQVPFIQVSTYCHNAIDYLYKDSPISKVIGEMKDLLSTATDHTICIKLHQRPIFYSLPAMCNTCNGAKEVRVKVENGKDKMEPCGTCNGVGMVSHLKTDVGQGYSLPYIETNDGGFPGAQPPCGYVTPDNESLVEQRNELEFIKRAIERGALGVEGLLSLDERSNAETATGRSIDLQPIMDTLEPFSQNASIVRQFLTDRVGEIWSPSFEKSYIYYGRKYFLRSEQQVLDELKHAKEAGASKSFIKELMTELYWIQFEGNPMARDRAILLLDVEPFPEVGSTEELVLLKEFADPVMLIVKSNFNDFIERFEEENGNIVAYQMEQDYATKVKDIKSILYKYGTEAKGRIPQPVDPAQAGAAQAS